MGWPELANRVSYQGREYQVIMILGPGRYGIRPVCGGDLVRVGRDEIERPPDVNPHNDVPDAMDLPDCH